MSGEDDQIGVLQPDVPCHQTQIGADADRAFFEKVAGGLRAAKQSLSRLVRLPDKAD
jgi:hypothetical protein